MLALLKNRSMQTILIISIYALFADMISMKVNIGLYTISLLIKDILMLFLPITVGVFIASTISSFERKAPLFILALVLFEACSNFLSIWYAFAAGSMVSSFIEPISIVTNDNKFEPLWRLSFIKPSWWNATNGSMAGIIIGCTSALLFSKQLRPLLDKGRRIMELILTKFFARLIPLFILGFVAQIHSTGLLGHMIVHYSVLIIYLLVVVFSYILFIFLAGNWFRLSNAIKDIQNLLPAFFISITSGCSLSTMPWTIEGTAKNVKNPSLAKAIIPATTNVQQIGDCIINCFLCFLVFKNFFGQNPDILTWSTFSMVVIVTRFAAAAVLGGVLFLMLPIYQHYLGFTDEMLAIIIAFNIILDPIVTCSNVMANGGLAKIFEKLWDNILFANKKEPQLCSKQSS